MLQRQPLRIASRLARPVVGVQRALVTTQHNEKYTVAPPSCRTVWENRLRHHCRRRGIRELDLIMSTFADEKLESLTSEELMELEKLIAVESLDLLAWLMGQCDPPEEWRHSSIFRQLQTSAFKK